MRIVAGLADICACGDFRSGRRIRRRHSACGVRARELAVLYLRLLPDVGQFIVLGSRDADLIELGQQLFNGELAAPLVDNRYKLGLAGLCAFEV